MNDPAAEEPSGSELRAFACRLLGRREYSVLELRQRLQRKWPTCDSARIDELLEALVAENLLSDDRFAESYVRSQIQRLNGPRKIRAALRGRGVADSLIERELATHAGEWQELASRWLARQHSGPIDFKAKSKYYRRLLNRGFSHDQAMDALNDERRRPK